MSSPYPYLSVQGCKESVLTGAVTVGGVTKYVLSNMVNYIYNSRR